MLDDGAAAGKPLVVRKAVAFALMLEEMPIYIQELIVGGRTLYGRGDTSQPGPTFKEGQAFSLHYYPRYATDEDAPRRTASPERYKDLVVRVWGFNAYFTTLAKDYQDYIIQRTAQVL